MGDKLVERGVVGGIENLSFVGSTAMNG